MPVYRAQKNQKKKTKPNYFLLGLLAVLLIAAVLFAVSASTRAEAAQAMAAGESEEEVISGEGPEAALKAIYEQSDVRGVSTLNNMVLDEKFGVTMDLYLKTWGRYSSGTYGLADVFIFRTLEGKEEALREALEQVKTARIVEARNYDIYNSLEHAEEGQIFQVGEDYICLIMIENADQVREILEDCLLED